MIALTHISFMFNMDEFSAVMKNDAMIETKICCLQGKTYFKEVIISEADMLSFNFEYIEVSRSHL
jgi:hypothetical protein